MPPAGSGVLAAYKRNTWVDQAVMIAALLGVSLPGFWIAILSVILFSVTLGWVPSAGYVPLNQGVEPWFAALIQPANFAGVVTAEGGADGHTAVMLRALGLPAVLGATGLLEAVTPGMLAVMDAAASSSAEGLMSIG